MKKLVLSVLALALFATTALSNVQLATAAYDAEYLAAFDWAKENGLTSMADADAFAPYRNLSRSEWSKFIGNFGEDFLCLEANPEAECDFADAAQVSPYLTDAVAKACELGLMRGSNGNFYPNTFVSKAQVLATLVRGMEDYMDETTSPWYANYHAYALENGITTVEDVNTFDRPVSRQEALLMLYRARDYECDFETVVETGTVATGVVTPGTNRATLIKNAMSPMGDNGTIYIAKQSTNNEVLKFDVSSTENGNLTTVTLKLNDTLMDRNAAKVSITDADGVKVTNVRTFNNFAEATLSFTTPVALKANELKSFYVLFDFSGSVNQRGSVAVTAATLSNGAATVEGNVVSANINTIDVSNQSRIEFNSQNTVSTYVSPVSCTTATYVYVGDTNRLLGRFSLNNTSSTKSVSVKAIRLKSAKNLNGIVSNLKLEVGTGIVDANVVIDGKYVTFVMDYALPYSTLRTFYVKGDIVGGDKDDPIEFRLDDASDITARETVSNLAVNTTIGTLGKFSALYCVKEGSNTISRSDTLSNMNVPMREPLIFGLRANVNTKSAIRVEKVNVYVDNRTTAGAFFQNPDRSAENFRLYVNNVMVDSTSTVTCMTPGFFGSATNPMCYVTFNYYGDLVAGANALEVRFDSKSNGVAGDRLRFKIDNSSVAFAGNAEYVSTQNDVSLTDFNGVAQGAEMIITNAAVDNISRTDGYANGKVLIRESSDFTAIKFAVRANNVRDLVLNGFRTTAAFNPTTGNANYITDVMAYVDGVLVSTQSFNNGLTATFNSLGIVIPRGSQKEVTLKVTTTSTHPESVVGAAGDVRYTVDNWDLDDTNGNSVANTSVLNGANIDVAGSVTVECKNINPIVTSIVALSSDPVRVASFEFRAKNGNAVINELSLANVLGTQTTVPSSYDVNNLAGLGYDTSADGVLLDLFVGSTKVGEAKLINSIAYAINLNGGAGITLPNNTSVIVDVRARGTTESTSLTKTLRLGVVPSVGYSVLGGTAQTMVAAQNSSAAATLGTCGTVANTQLIRNSKLTVTATIPSVTPLLNNVSLNTLFRGSLTTAGSSIQLKKFTFNVNSNTTGTLANTKLFIDGNEYSVSQGNATVSGTTVPGTVTVTLNTAQPVSASTASIELKSDVTFTDVANIQEVISTRILKGSPVDYAGYSTDTLVPSTATIVWSANDGSSDVWYTDSGILGLETDSYSLKN